MDEPKHPIIITGKRARGAREIAASKWGMIADRCWLCGLAIGPFLEIAHLDQRRSNNDPDNLAYLCPTCHRMLDVGVITEERVTQARDELMKDGHVFDYDQLRKAFEANAANGKWSLLQKGAQERGGAKIARKAAARKAWHTRRTNVDTREI